MEKKNGFIYVWKRALEIYPDFWLEFTMLQFGGFFVGFFLGVLVRGFVC